MSLDKLVPTDSKGYEWLGGYNDPPPGFREVPASDIYTNMMFGFLTPVRIGYKQIALDSTKPFNLLSIHFYIYHDNTAVAWSVSREGIRWFRFEKCVHEKVEKNIGQCMTRVTCKKCDFIEDVDSSD